MKKLLTLLAVALLASGAIAQIDPDDNGIGVYMDTDGMVTCGATATPYESATAYLLITRPTDLDGVSGWEANVAVSGGALAPVWTLSAGLDVDSSDEGFQVGIGTGPLALPYGPTILLATWTGLVPTTADVIAFTVSGVPGSTSFDDSPGYASGADAGLLIPLQSSSGYPYTVCGQINGQCEIVANEDLSFGQVKTLFQ